MVFDIICLIILIAGLVIGFYRGFLSQVSAFFGILLGIVCCNVFADKIAAGFIDPADSPQTVMLITVLTYVAVFVGCFLLGRIIGKLFKSLIKALRVGILDKMCGAFFTLFEYALIFSLLLNLWVSLFPTTVLRTDYEGVKRIVFNLGPEVLGSKTISDIYGSVHSAVHDASQSLLGEPEKPDNEQP